MKLINNKIDKSYKSKIIYNVNQSSKNNNLKNENKYSPPAHLEWIDSSYSFNKNNNKDIPILNNFVWKLIKIYLNMYNVNLEEKIKLYKLSYIKRWLSSSRKIWVAKPEIKHNNEKIIVNLYLYDRTSNIILTKLKEQLDTFFTRKMLIIKNKKILKIKSNSVFNNLVESKIYRHFIMLFNKNFDKLNSKSFKNVNNAVSNSLIILLTKLKLILSDKILKHEMNILYYKKYMFINNSKYKNTFISILQKLIGKIFNKKVIFNIVILKNYFLNNDIFTQIIINLSKNRKIRPPRLLSAALRVKTPLFRKNIINKALKQRYNQSIALKYVNYISKTDNNFDSLLVNYFNLHKKELEQSVISNLKNKLVIGIRLKIGGRLTRRSTAERTVKILKYIGTLKNIDSSFKGLSTHVLRNNLNNNLQYNRTKSSNRLGSFGIKGWTSSI